MTLGVSVVVCCHNSAKRLPQTLAHLIAQQVRKGLEWEVIVIDNASRDETGQVALASWPADAPAPLRVVCEPHSGLTNARYRGLAEAKYELISFVDDDNWVCPEWVQMVSEVMSEHRDLGACGGSNDGVCQVDPPWWFEGYRSSYAVGPQGSEAGDITWTRGYLWGAGLTIRKSAWQRLVEEGFRHLLSDRRGKTLNAGGDSELCFALRLAGWRLWYEPRLRLRHSLPANRLKWNYLRRLHRGFGASSVGFDPYLFAPQKSPESLEGQTKQAWRRESLEVLKRLRQDRNKVFKLLYHGVEGDPEALATERLIGRLSQLLRRRDAYDMSFREISDAAWRRVTFSQYGNDRDARTHSSITSVLGTRAIRIAVDLTPILPEGENGGAKVMALELIKQLGQAAPELEFVLLTSENNHEELSTLDAVNVWRLRIARHESHSHSQARVVANLKNQMKDMILSMLPPPLVTRLKDIYRSRRSIHPSMVDRWRGTGLLRKIFADVLFCPFTAPFYFDPSVPTVSVLYDLQYFYYPYFFSPRERDQRHKSFKSACGLADKLVCISDYVRGTVLQRAEVGPERLVTVHPRLFSRLRRSLPETVAQVLNRFGLEPGQFLLYPSNFWPHKNHRVLLTSFGIYRTRHPKSVLKLVCPGSPNSDMAHLSQAAERMGLGGRVVFPGFVTDDELAALLESCLALIYPSLFEGFGMPVLEAMAFGKPVLCSGVTSLPEVAGDAALFFDPTKPIEIVEAIERIEEDHELVAQLIQRGHQRLIGLGGSAEMVRQYLQVFREVLSSHLL